MKKFGIITSVLIGVAMLGGSTGSVMAASSVDTTPIQVTVAQAEQPYQGMLAPLPKIAISQTVSLYSRPGTLVM